MSKRRHQQTLIDDEDKEIRTYAKKLGLNKRRKKDAIPKSFADAGLDYVLELCQSAGKSKEEENPVDVETTAPRRRPKLGKESVEPREDIYGRVRDEKGDVVRDARPRSSAVSNLAVGPKLVRSLKGSLNRLSESNARQIANEIDQLLLTYSKNDVKTTLTNAIFGVCLAKEIVAPRLVMEHCFLLALLHSSSSAELSAYFIEQLARKFHELHTVEENQPGDKRLNNVGQVFAFCYQLTLISSGLIIQLLKDLLRTFAERDVELILLLLQNVGFVLRKDDPLELKSFMSDVHKKINDPENADLKNESRTRFMLDTLMAIKNNNDMKIANYDPSLPEHFRKILRAAVKTIEPALPMNLHDLYEADEKGRWWVVGSAVASNFLESRKLDGGTKSKSTQPEFSDSLLDLARKHRMNTDLRRTIFCIVMSAEDYLDAFQKLIKLDLKGQQERQIVHVCLTCCLNERQFNPYYGFVIRQLCQFHKRFQLTTQFAIWDKFKLLNDFQIWQRKNLALLMSQLITCKAISLAILKVFEFGELETKAIRLLKMFFKQLLLNCSTAELIEIFKKISKDQLKVLFDSILVFLQHFFSQGDAKLPEKKVRLLNERIAVIEKLQFAQ